MPVVMALRLAGWWMTTVATGPVTSCSNWGSMSMSGWYPSVPQVIGSGREGAEGMPLRSEAVDTC